MRVSFTAHTTLLCASTSVHLHHGNDFENNVFFRMSFVLYSFLTSHSAHFAVIILPFFPSLVSAWFFAFWQKRNYIVEREKWSISQHLKLKRVSGTRKRRWREYIRSPPQHIRAQHSCAGWFPVLSQLSTLPCLLVQRDMAHVAYITTHMKWEFHSPEFSTLSRRRLYVTF